MKAELLLKKISHNWFGICICLGAAVILYLFVHITRIEKRTFSVPLVPIGDGRLTQASGIPRNVTVTVRAEAENILNITGSDITANLDFSYYSKEGAYEIPVTLSLSPEVLLTDPVELTVFPETYSVVLEEKIRRSVPVSVPTSGNPLHGYELKEVRLYPDEAVISGPRSMVESVGQLSTDEIILTERKDDFKESKGFVNTNKYIEVVSPSEVSVSVSFQTSLVSKTFSNCHVFLAHLPSNLEVENAPEISFTVSGAELILEKFYPSEYTVQADCSHISLPGDYEIPVVIAVQDAFKIEKQSSNSVKIRVREKEAASSPSETENVHSDLSGGTSGDSQ